MIRLWMWVTLLTMGWVAAAPAQSVRSLVNGGNDRYYDQNYADAEIKYRKALEKEHQLVEGQFNLGNALYKQGKYDEAVRAYEAARQGASGAQARADASYNMGNAWMKAQDYQKAIGSYIDALKLNPDDQEAKYNLSYALRMLQQQQQQQNKQQNQQQNKQQKNNDKNKQQNNDQDKNRQPPQQQQRQPQQQQQQQKERQISKADAERILEVLKNNEREIQKKRQAKQAVRPRTEKDW